MASNKVNKADVENGGVPDFYKESENQIVEEFDILGEVIIEAAKRSVTEIREWIEELKRQNEDQQHLEGRISTSNEIPLGNAKANMHIDEDFPCNKGASILVNKFPQILNDELGENVCEDVENQKDIPNTMLEEDTELLNETSIGVCVQDDYGGELTKPTGDLKTGTEMIPSRMVGDNADQDSENGDDLPTVESNQQNDPLSNAHGGENCSHSHTDNFPVTLVRGEASANIEVPVSCPDQTHDGETRIFNVSKISYVINKAAEAGDIQLHSSCFERQSTNGVHLSGSGANSTQVSSVTGSPPEGEMSRSGCLNIEGVMFSEHAGDLPPTNRSSLSIKEESKDSVVVKSTLDNTDVVEDDENIACPHTSPQQLHTIKDDKISATDSSLSFKIEDGHEKNKSKTTKKNNKKKKAKVNKKDKRLEDETEHKRTKSKKFRRRLLSLFCCCFKSKEMNDENNETEESRTERSRSDLETSSKASFVTVDFSA